METSTARANDDQKEKPNERFPIRTVSSLTGINSVTLRAWERRYKLIRPKRTDTGHRVYDQEDIDRINQAIGLVKKGVTISQAAKMINNGLELPVNAIETDHQTWLAYRQRILTAITTFDEALLEDVYQQALSHHPVQTVTRMLIIPSLKELGSRWENAEGGIAEEHFFSVFLRNKIGARFHHRSRNNTGPKLLCACLPNESHEIGILLFALAANENNYRQVMLGANVPLLELPIAVKRAQADAIVLSGKTELPLRVIDTELRYLTKAVEIPVFLGGEVIENKVELIETAGAIPMAANIQDSLQILDQHMNSRQRMPTQSAQPTSLSLV